MLRDEEERLVSFIASRSLDPRDWLQHGDAFFVAGLAVLLASLDSFDRRSYLALAEALYPSATTPEVFQIWLDGGRLDVSRFVSMLLQEY